jgi:NADH:ubiquinone oxidoreductase subunit 2 (subunit N)
MEGPTTSSAIFYGSLSVHIGAFLLLRTMPLWENVVWMKFAIAGIGLLTAFIATGIAKVQSTVKTQIAYASAAQIGIIFIELAFGLEWLALFHFSANAFFRTYQLLVSPSVMNYMIHNQFFTHEDAPAKASGRWRNTLYILSIKEWNVDTIFRKIAWTPFKWIGRVFRSASPWPFATVGIATIAVGILPHFADGIYPDSFEKFHSEIFSGIAVVFVLVGFASRGDALRAWKISSLGVLILLLAFTHNSGSTKTDFIVYAAGILPAMIIGAFCLYSIRSIDGNIDLNRYHGYSHERPVTTLVFLLSGLGLIGFPITSAFIGLDVLLTGIEHHRIVFLVFAAMVIAFAELTALRIYARVFLGQHKKQDHPVAFKAS